MFEPKVNSIRTSTQTESDCTIDEFRILSMFAGCGGLDLGFSGGFVYRNEEFPRLPTKIVGAYDNDHKAKRTYDTNFDHKLNLCDLSKACIEEMPNADILIGGFPCQEFSICGPRGGIESRRGGLFRVMSRYAKHYQPKLIVAENVAHLERINNGEDLKTILRSLKLAGYKPQVWPIYAPDYGVPQARKRIIIVGVRKDIETPLSPPEQKFKKHRSTHWAISDLRKVTDESVPNQSQYFRAALAKRGHGQGDEVNPRHLPAYTIRANGRSRVQFHYDLPRRLTVRECARIQTFPDNFVFPDEATPSIRQIGNAVPPILGYHIANHLISFLHAIKTSYRPQV